MFEFLIFFGALIAIFSEQIFIAMFVLAMYLIVNFIRHDRLKDELQQSNTKIEQLIALVSSKKKVEKLEQRIAQLEKDSDVQTTASVSKYMSSDAEIFSKNKVNIGDEDATVNAATNIESKTTKTAAVANVVNPIYNVRLTETPAKAITAVKTPEKAITSFEIPDEILTSTATADKAATSIEIPDEILTSTATADKAATSIEIPDEVLTSATTADKAATSIEIPDEILTSTATADKAATSIEIPDEVLTSATTADKAATSIEIPDEVLTSATTADKAAISIEIPDEILTTTTATADKAATSIEIPDEVLTSATTADKTTTQISNINLASSIEKEVKLNRVNEDHHTAQKDKVQGQGTSKPLMLIDQQDSGNNFISGIFSSIFNWFIKGNPLAKLGVIIVFFALAYLTKYSVDNFTVPMELRLAAAAVFCIVLLIIGWLLRDKKESFGLILQGGAIGGFYITIFAAAKVFTVLSIPAALAIMVVVCICSVLLAVLQNAITLSMLASIGGYAAPVLLSTGGGSHIMLFSYYLIISFAILAVSRFKAWRELNLLGLFFTFSIALAWGAKIYSNELYLSSQIFLIINIVLFGMVSVVFAANHHKNSQSTVDAVLFFTPALVGYFIQYKICDGQWPFATAFSALGFGAAYLLFGWWALQREGAVYKRICQFALAVGIGFVALAAPLALFDNWTTLVWLVEGLALLWAGIIQQQRRIRFSGMLLMGLSVLISVRFLATAVYDVTQIFPLFALAATGFIVADWLYDKYSVKETVNEKEFRRIFLIFSMIFHWSVTLVSLWKYITEFTLFTNLTIYTSYQLKLVIVLILISVSSLIWKYVGERLKWDYLAKLSWVIWPALALCLVIFILLTGFNPALPWQRQGHLLPACLIFAVGVIYMLLGWKSSQSNTVIHQRLYKFTLILGVIFVSLAVPLALSNQYTAIVWLVESLAMLWYGVKLQKWRVQWGSWLLMALAVIESLRFFAFDSYNINYIFPMYAFMVIVFLVADWLHRKYSVYESDIKKTNRRNILLVAMTVHWAIALFSCWKYITGFALFDNLSSYTNMQLEIVILLVLLSLSSLTWKSLGSILEWEYLDKLSWIICPALVIFLAMQIINFNDGLIEQQQGHLIPTCITLAFGLFYMLFGWWSSKQVGLACQRSYKFSLALGISFIAISIPLALSQQWTACIWLAQGLAVLWGGFKWSNRHFRWGGWLLIGISVFVSYQILLSGIYDFNSIYPVFALSAVGLLIADCLYKKHHIQEGFEQQTQRRLILLPAIALNWIIALVSFSKFFTGLATFAYLSGHVANQFELIILLALLSLSSLIWKSLGSILEWEYLDKLSWIICPALALFLSMQITNFNVNLIEQQGRLMPACIALVFGVFYMLVGWWSSKRLGLVCQRSYKFSLALGLSFITISIPLALSQQWTACIWLLQGLVVLWGALKWQNINFRLGGWLLIAISVFVSYQILFTGSYDFNSIYSIFILSAVSLLVADWLYKKYHIKEIIEHKTLRRLLLLPVITLNWTIALVSFWKFLTGLTAFTYLSAYVGNQFELVILLVLISLSCLIWKFLGEILKWDYLTKLSLVIWPALIIILVSQFFNFNANLPWQGTFFWLLFELFSIIVLYACLSKQKILSEQKIAHLCLFVMFILLAAQQVYYHIYLALPWQQNEWQLLVLFLFLVAIITLTQLLIKWAIKPFVKQEFLYHVIGCAPLVVSLVCLLVIGSFASGQIPSWFYLPIINPYEISAYLSIAVVAKWLLSLQKFKQKINKIFSFNVILIILAVITIWWLNTSLLRALAYYGEIAWQFDALWGSALVQTVFTLIWGIVAMCTIFYSTKLHSRQLWMIGLTVMLTIVVKLFLVDSGQSDTWRIFSAFGVGIVLIITGWLAPMPPKHKKES